MSRAQVWAVIAIAVVFVIVLAMHVRSTAQWHRQQMINAILSR